MWRFYPLAECLDAGLLAHGGNAYPANFLTPEQAKSLAKRLSVPKIHKPAPFVPLTSDQPLKAYTAK